MDTGYLGRDGFGRKGKKNMSLYYQQHKQMLLRPLYATHSENYNLVHIAKYMSISICIYH